MLAKLQSRGSLWGQTFVDYSYDAQTSDASQKGTNGFEFRRIYLGYDQDISEQFTARVLIQANNEDTAKSGAMDFTAQEVYLEWKNLIPLSSIYFGISATPSIAMAEKVWGYRSIEKVILDRNGLVAIDDMGVGIKGKCVADGSIGYALMVANGQGVRLENDKLKKFYGEFFFTPMKNGCSRSVFRLREQSGRAMEAHRESSSWIPSTVGLGRSGGIFRTVHNGIFNSLLRSIQIWREGLYTLRSSSQKICAACFGEIIMMQMFQKKLSVFVKYYPWSG